MKGLATKFYDMISAMLHQPRETNERFLRKRGWEPLKDGLDVWCNPSRPGADAHDIHTFRSAMEIACREAVFGPKPLAVHHHPGASL